MKQRLGIGRAFLGRPRLLILDEPTNGMDPEGTQEILTFLREKVTKEGLTIFISSHLMSEIEEFCDTVFVINQGRLVASGNVKELLKPHERVVRVTFQGKMPTQDFMNRHEQVQWMEPLTAYTLEITLARDDSAWLNRCLQQEGFEVSALTPKQKTLKEFSFPLPAIKIMHSQFLPLLRNEITKAVNRQVAILWTFLRGIALSGNLRCGRPAEQLLHCEWLGVSRFFHAIGVHRSGPIFIINFAATLFQETGNGTIRAALAAPVNRWELFAAKAAMGLLYMLVMSVVALLFSIVLAKINYHFGDVGDSLVSFTAARESREFLLGYALSLIPLVPLVAFGLFISTIIRTQERLFRLPRPVCSSLTSPKIWLDWNLISSRSTLATLGSCFCNSHRNGLSMAA